MARMFPVRHQTVMDFPPKSHRKLAAHPKRYSLPRFGNAVVVISIQRCNKNHINSGFFFFLSKRIDLLHVLFEKQSHTLWKQSLPRWQLLQKFEHKSFYLPDSCSQHSTAASEYNCTIKIFKKMHSGTPLSFCFSVWKNILLKKPFLESRKPS